MLRGIKKSIYLQYHHLYHHCRRCNHHRRRRRHRRRGGRRHHHHHHHHHHQQQQQHQHQHHQHHQMFIILSCEQLWMVVCWNQTTLCTKSHIDLSWWLFEGFLFWSTGNLLIFMSSYIMLRSAEKLSIIQFSFLKAIYMRCDPSKLSFWRYEN